MEPLRRGPLALIDPLDHLSPNPNPLLIGFLRRLVPTLALRRPWRGDTPIAWRRCGGDDPPAPANPHKSLNLADPLPCQRLRG